MSLSLGQGTKINSQFVIANSGNTYGTNYSYLGVGGFYELATTQDRNNIPIDSLLVMNADGFSSGRRRLEMIVHTLEDDKYWQLSPQLKIFYKAGPLTFTVSATTERVTESIWNTLTSPEKLVLLDPMASVFDSTTNRYYFGSQDPSTAWYDTPFQVYITGGTYNSGTTTLQLFDTSGNTISITGFSNGIQFDTKVTAFTYSNNKLTITDNSGITYSAVINSFTGLTINGNLNVTGNSTLNNLSATTISATTYLNLPIDPDRYVTGFTYSANTFTISDNSGNTYNATINNVTGLTVNGNLNVTGNSTLNNLSATTISATTYLNLPIDPDRYVTGFTYSANTFTISDNSGNTYNATINTVTGITVNGNLNVTGNTTLNNLSATTISATTISGGTLYGDGFNLTNIKNIYNIDGSLISNRTLSLNSFNLTISGTSSSRFFANGRLAVGTTSDLGNQFVVSSIADPVRFENMSTITADTFLVTANSNGVLRELGGAVANRIPYFNSSSAITTTPSFEFRTPTSTATLVIPGNGEGATGSQIRLNNGRTSLTSTGIGGLDIYVGNGQTGGVIDQSKQINFQNNGRNYLTLLGEGLTTTAATASTRAAFTSRVSIDTGTTPLGRNYWGTTGVAFSVVGRPWIDITSTGGTQTDLAYASFGIPTFTALSGTNYNGIYTVYIDGSPTLGSNVSGTTYAMYVRTGNILFGGLQSNSVDTRILTSTSSGLIRYRNFSDFTGGTGGVSGDYLPLSGGTVTGATIFQSGLTATTISATTYFNLPIDPDTFVTGFSLTNDVITLNQNRNDQYSAFTISLSAYTGNTGVSGDYLPLSGGTVTGATIFQSGLTANTISATTYLNLPIDPDVYVTGFTYSANTFTIFDNSGNTFDATFNDVTGLTVNGNLNVTGDTTLNNLSANTISATTYLNLPVFVGDYLPLSGGTVTGDTIFQSGLTANTISATTYLNLPIDPDVYVTGFTYNDSNTFSIFDNSGTTFDATINYVTGLTVNGVLTITATTGQTFGVINFGNDPFIHNYGTGNTYVGAFAGSFSGTGSDNTGIGEFVLDNLDDGYDNTGLGALALTDLTGGTFNTALGAGSLQNLISGDNNTAVGVASNALLQSGSGNTSFGFESLFNNINGSGNVVIGNKAGYNETGNNKLYIANNDTTTLIYGEFDNQRVGINTTSPTNTLHVSASTDPVRFIGLQLSSDTRVVTTDTNGVLHYIDLSGITGNTIIGDYLPLSGGTVTGDTIFQSGLTANTISATTISGGTFYGDGSNLTNIDNIYNINGSLISNRVVDLSGYTLGFKRSFNVNDSFLNLVDSSDQILIEFRSSIPNSGITTVPNLFIGKNSGSVTSTGMSTNLVIGNNSLTGATTALKNFVLGNNSFTSLNQGSFNIVIGDTVGTSFSGGTGSTANDNIFIGNGSALNKQTGRYNVHLGSNTRENAISGDNNTIIGTLAGRNSSSSSGNVFLGFSAGRNETGSNLLYIENSSSASPLIYGDFANDLLRFNSKVGVNVLPGTYQFDVNGTANIRGYLYLQPSTPSTAAVIINQNSNDGSLVWGSSALNLNPSFSTRNVIISPSGTYSSLVGVGNTLIGRAAGSDLSTGVGNTFIGKNAGLGITTGGFNIVLHGGDTNNLPSATTKSIIIAPNFRSNDASSMPTSIYAFIGGQFGSSDPIQDYYFGAMPFTPDTTASTLTTLNFYAPSGLGTDLPGSNFKINAGRGTGTGLPGDIIFATSTSGTSSSSLQTLTDRWRVKGNSGRLSNITSPTNILHVSASTHPVRFEGLQLSSDTRIVTTDSNGELHYLNLSTITASTSADTYTTGFTYSANTFTMSDNSGNTLSATINNVTGLTINGNMNVTGDTTINNLTANTISATTISGGTFFGNGSGMTNVVISVSATTGLSGNSTNGNITLVNTAPDQVVTITGGTNIQIAGSYPNFGVNFTGQTEFPYLPLSGGTVTGDTIFQSGLTATTISATTYLNLPVDPDTYVTGFTYSANTFYIYDNSGATFDATINQVTGLTVNGNLNVTGNTILNNITATTISASTYVNLPFNYYITGSTPTGAVLNYGDRWYNTNNGIELVWITDGNSDQWVQPAYNTIPQAYNNVLVTSGITTSSATLSMNVNYYGINYNGNVDLTLPSPVGYDGYNMNIKDEGGYAGTTRIRITPSSGTIDGNPYVDMNINYMSLHVVARNNNWWII